MGRFSVYVRWLLGWRYILCYAVLTSSNKGETAVHCYDPALSVLVMLVSPNVVHVVALHSIVCHHEKAGRRGEGYLPRPQYLR